MNWSSINTCTERRWWKRSASRRQAGYQLLWGGANSLKCGRAANPGRKGGYIKVPIAGGTGAAHVEENDDTAPDIACAIRAVARIRESPEMAHKKAVLKVMLYPLHMEELGVTYGEQGCGLNKEACTDSEFGACLDTRHSSVPGAVVMLEKTVVRWHSRMQEVIRWVPQRRSTLPYQRLLKICLF